jgi:hypothetical protein
MIEFRKNADDKYELFIDGLPADKGVGVSHRTHKGDDNNPEDHFVITIRNEEIKNKLLLYSYSELPRHVEISFFEELDWTEAYNSVRVSPRTEVDSYEIEITFIGGGTWRGAYSFADYCTELIRVMSGDDNPEIHSYMSDIWRPQDGRDVKFMGFLSSLPITFYPSSPHLPIADEYARFSRLLDELHKEVTRTLDSRIRSESVVTYFDFPEEVRVPCEQYLLYFVQFLKDLGVEATAELQHQAGQVLFAVTPSSKEEALDQIREALSDYLRLAASPVNPASVLSSEIEVQRLAAQIQHLQGQLTLAHAVIQAKDAAIQLQQTTIIQQQRMLGGEIMIESMKDVTPKAKESEEVFGGLAEIKKYEGKGFSLNLPEAFRLLRKKYRKEASEE